MCDRVTYFVARHPHAKLTAHLLDEVSDHWKSNTRSRQIACQKFQRLADFAGIASKVKDRQGDYRLSNVQRVIPDDKDIIAAIDGMKNKAWQWIAAMMATYNLRDHEAFLCDIEWRDYDGQRWLVALVPDGIKASIELSEKSFQQFVGIHCLPLSGDQAAKLMVSCAKLN
jgi:hypothetical protein